MMVMKEHADPSGERSVQPNRRLQMRHTPALSPPRTFRTLAHLVVVAVHDDLASVGQFERIVRAVSFIQLQL